MRLVRWFVVLALVIAGIGVMAANPQAVLSNGHVMVPLRNIADWFGSPLKVDSRTHAITITDDDETITVTVGSADAVINGKRVTMPAKVIEANGMAYFPLCVLALDDSLSINGDGERGVLMLEHPDCEQPITFPASQDVLRGWQREVRGGANANEDSSEDESPTPKGREQRSTPAGNWQLYRDPLGFQVKCAPGWQVNTSGGDAILLTNDDQQAVIFILPFVAKPKVSAGQCVREKLLALQGFFPNAKLGQLKQTRKMPDEAVGTFSYRRAGQAGKANVLCSVYQRGGMLYIIGADNDTFATAKPTMLAMLKSFSFTQLAKTAQAAHTVQGHAQKVTYRTWGDPTEKAFTVEIPQGWQAQGGMARHHAVDVKPAFSVTSPDGKIQIFCGDPSLRPYIQPVPDFGMTEGALNPLSSGLLTICKTYLTGAQFAGEFSQTKFGHLSGFGIDNLRDLPEAARKTNELVRQYGLPMTLNTGDATFSATRNGVPFRGYCFVGDILMANPGNPYMWSIDSLYGYFAGAAQEATAQAVLAHMVKTFRMSPEWQRMQSGITMRTAQIEHETSQAVSKFIGDTFAEKNKVQDNAMRNWSNTTLGLTDVCDQATNETWKVTSGHNYYWRRGNTVVGTNTYNPPDIDFTPLNEW